MDIYTVARFLISLRISQSQHEINFNRSSDETINQILWLIMIMTIQFDSRFFDSI